MAYAWARIMLGGADNKVIEPGDEVKEADLPDGDYDIFMREGIIKDKPFPNDVQYGESARTAMIRSANEQYEEATQPPEAQTLDAPSDSKKSSKSEASDKPWEK